MVHLQPSRSIAAHALAEIMPTCTSTEPYTKIRILSPYQAHPAPPLRDIYSPSTADYVHQIAGVQGLAGYECLEALTALFKFAPNVVKVYTR